MKNEKILIVIPAFNEQQNIAAVIEAVKKHIPDSDILVVNDCSQDETALCARQAGGVKVIDLPCNLGIGGAVQTGFKFARNNGYRYMAQVDGDGQHVPGEVAKLQQVMRQSGCDMVIGSRFLDVDSFRTSWARRLGIKVFYYLFRLLIHDKITDGTSGFRLYNRSCIELLASQYPDDYPEPDAVVLLKKHGLQICEVGVRMRPREYGESSITPLKSPYYMAKVMVSIFFSYSRTR